MVTIVNDGSLMYYRYLIVFISVFRNGQNLNCIIIIKISVTIINIGFFCLSKTNGNNSIHTIFFCTCCSVIGIVDVNLLIDIQIANNFWNLM